jgi:hypothetical protein
MKKELKKKVYVKAIGSMVAVCAKAVLSEKQFEKTRNNKERVNHMLDGINVKLWFINNAQTPYNLGILSPVTGNTTSEAIAKEEEHMKDVLDQLIEQIDKLPEHNPAENRSEEAEEATKEANDLTPGDDEPSDDNEKFIRSLAKDVEISLKHHFGEDVEYALFVSAGSCVGIDSTIHPLKIIHMMAYAAQNQ